MAKSITILLVDDHALLCDALRRALDAETGFEVVDAVSDARTAIERASELQPDIVIMDIDMPGMDSFQASERILEISKDTRLVFLSGYFHDQYIDAALRLEARGYLSKGEPLDRIADSVRLVAQGRVVFSEEVQARIVVGPQRPTLATAMKTRTATLSPREIQVLRYLAKGKTKKEIASLMELSVKTVESHADRIMRKTDVHDRVGLALLAVREGIIEA
ncbi:MAG: response regulator [Planctomycetota bacterium]|jgi:DNA-binding NarL/FixJ family response regulator